MQGAGGFGKTALAERFCRDRDVRGAFHGGVLWTTLGEQVGEGGQVERLNDLVGHVTGTRPEHTRPETARAAFAEAPDDRRCLLVIDDAWRREDAAPFLRVRVRARGRDRAAGHYA